MEWFSALYDPETEGLHRQRALTLGEGIATLRHLASKAPLGGLFGDVAALQAALSQAEAQFPPGACREALWRTTDASPNPPAPS